MGQNSIGVDSKNLEAVEQYVKTLPKVHAFGQIFNPTLETVVSELVNEWLLKRDLARLLKKKIVMIDEGKVYTLKPTGTGAGAPSADLIARAAKIHPKATILNGLPKEQAESLYLEAMRPKRDIEPEQVNESPSP